MLWTNGDIPMLLFTAILILMSIIWINLRLRNLNRAPLSWRDHVKEDVKEIKSLYGIVEVLIILFFMVFIPMLFILFNENIDIEFDKDIYINETVHAVIYPVGIIKPDLVGVYYFNRSLSFEINQSNSQNPLQIIIYPEDLQINPTSSRLYVEYKSFFFHENKTKIVYIPFFSN
jgi:hypothetical protein